MDSAKSIVIEFVGPPGSGKTTTCNSAVEYLKHAGIKIYVFKDVKAYLYQSRLAQKAAIIFRTLLRHSMDLFSFKILLVKHGGFNVNSVFRYAKLCLFNQALQHFKSTKTGGIILLDQWVIQGLWSATIFSVKDPEKMRDSLKRFYFPVDYIVYFDIDVDTAVQRIETRGTFTSRFDNMTDEERTEIMHLHNHYLKNLFLQSTGKSKWLVSTTVSLQQNVTDFVERLKQLKVID